MHVRALPVVVLATTCALTLAACGGSGSGASGSSVTSDAVSTTASSPSASPTKPLSYYAAQYTTIVAPANKLIDQLSAASNASAADQQKIGTKVAAAIQLADQQLLRVNWPGSTGTDVKAQVNADGPLIGDLNDLANTSSSTASRDSAAANSAANIVRADLALPAVN